MNILEDALNFAKSELGFLTAKDEINYNGIKDKAELAFKNLQAARKCIFDSFEVGTYKA